MCMNINGSSTRGRRSESVACGFWVRIWGLGFRGLDFRGFRVLVFKVLGV